MLALRWLSAEQRAAAVRGWLSSAEPQARRFDEARELLGILEGDELDALLDVIRGANAEVSAEFASEAWRLLPDRAFEEARHALGERLASARGWFLLAPRRYLGRLLALVQAAPASAAVAQGLGPAPRRGWWQASTVTRYSGWQPRRSETSSRAREGAPA